MARPSTEASAATVATADKAQRFGQPPPYLDGRSHFLDASYQHVASFGKRPGAAASAQVTPGHSMQYQHLDDDPQVGPSSHLRSPRHQADGDEEEDNDAPASSSTDSEWEYEDLPPEIVILDLGPHASNLLQSKRHWSATGMETATPYLKVGNIVFKGKWEESIGTGIVLRDEVDHTMPWPNQHHPSPLPHPLPTMTHNRINFKMAHNLDVSQSAVHRRSEQVQAEINSSTQQRQKKKKKRQTTGQTGTASNSRSEAADDDNDDDEEEEQFQDDVDNEVISPVISPSTLLPLSSSSLRTTPNAKPRGRRPLTFAQRTQRAIQRALQTDHRSNANGKRREEVRSDADATMATNKKEHQSIPGRRTTDASGALGTAAAAATTQTATMPMIKKKRGRPSKKDLEARAAAAAAHAASGTSPTTTAGAQTNPPMSADGAEQEGTSTTRHLEERGGQAQDETEKEKEEGEGEDGMDVR